MEINLISKDVLVDKKVKVGSKRIKAGELEVTGLVTRDSITVYFEKPENLQITGKCLDHDNKYYEVDCMELIGFDEPGHELKNILLKDIVLGCAEEPRRHTLAFCACAGITICNLKCW